MTCPLPPSPPEHHTNFESEGPVSRMKSSERPDVSPELTTSREPELKAVPGTAKGTHAANAFNDAVFVIVACWVLLFLMGFSLRSVSV